MESDIRWGLKDPEAGEEAQTLGRPARDRGLPLPNTCEDRVGIPSEHEDDDDDVYYYDETDDDYDVH